MASNDLKDYIVTLQCLVVPQENIPRRRISNRLTILTINISGFLSIGHLKETIYEKKPTAFTNVSADDLDLSLVKISCEELLAGLLPVEVIAKIFPRDSPPPSEHVHILVEQPICGSSDDFQYEIRPRCENDKIRITTACVYTTPETSVVIESLLRQEIRHVMHRNIDNFFGSIFPMSQSQALVIDEIMEKCKQEEKWNNEWIGWPKDGSLETQFYQPVLVLVNYVIQQCNRTSGKFARTAVVHANCCPIQNRICAVARKPDIVLVDCSNVQRREGEPVVHWSDIHVVGEIKRTDKNDNVNTDLELAGYVREIFGNQPTRRFVFGFTIYGASIRIWLFDRSGGIGSHAFSIHKDLKMFI
ncbi:hypothetical protein RirG_122880 [Rhizophagus irregularis DAOM 197198w]|uniref:Uncharacterized protein n=2 Tax=Rhizophagus irregularis TaxID=588596 RepID=A0A015MI36_RHIIW|nr:hypothetical protein RirG_122880 [Rhizophagus irregularis DAOM 197198w]